MGAGKIREYFNAGDGRRIEALGSSLDKVAAELECFERGVPYLKIVRPCTLGDGIRKIGKDECLALSGFFSAALQDKEIVKFVPASGAASRMFKELQQFNDNNSPLPMNEVKVLADSGNKSAKILLKFMLQIDKFAFLDDLKAVLREDGIELESLVEEGDIKPIIDSLLTAGGLNYAAFPKGLIKFHNYPEGGRTAFAEHLVEAVDYARGRNNEAHIHFTVSPEHQTEFTKLLAAIKNRYEEEYNIRFVITFSVQERSTDTIAVDLKNRPFRENDGSLLFRPGGHGALLENLNRLKYDIVFIKNIDNVVPDRLKGESSMWKRVLGGQLLKVQRQIFTYLKQLNNQSSPDDILSDEIFTFIRQELSILPPAAVEKLTDKERIEFLIKVLNRPLRVCGMVKNEGEPGGGPFWVEDKTGTLSLQIVEGSQIDKASPQQIDILQAATHFNPVDLVCGICNWRGEKFDLKQFVDPDAVFISTKSKNGRELKALELPGLWNGAMAYWNTIFVEVPLLTFNPVKSVNDLLRPEHQP